MLKKALIFLALVLTLLTASIILFFRKELLILIKSGAYDSSKQTAFFHGAMYMVPTQFPPTNLSFDNELLGIKNSDLYTSDVLGASSKEKRIEVDLTKQKLYAFEGNKKKMSFDVSTGKWGKTPTGDFRIWTKLKYTLMKGGSKELGTYYYLPNVPFTMFFYKDFGIHGAYWHSNFGHPMSHGCVNMKPADAEKLFYWANPPLPKNTNSVLASNEKQGTRVVIYGTAPNE